MLGCACPLLLIYIIYVFYLLALLVYYDMFVIMLFSSSYIICVFGAIPIFNSLFLCVLSWRLLGQIPGFGHPPETYQIIIETRMRIDSCMPWGLQCQIPGFGHPHETYQIIRRPPWGLQAVKRECSAVILLS